MKNYYYKDGIYKNTLMETLGKEMQAHLVDRTGILDQQSAILSPLPQMPTTSLDYSAVCDARARELLKKSEDENKEIRVAYSGGLDSTTALVGLLKFREEYPGADITVCLNQKSIDEYPLFFTDFIEGNIHYFKGESYSGEGVGENVAIGEMLSHEGEKDFFIVTGEIGDQIFGSKNILNDPENAFKDYREEFNPIMADYLEPLVDEMPIKDSTCGGVLSWLNFNLKYQWCQLRMYLMFDIPYEKYHHFFDTVAFQQWSMSTPVSEKFPDFSPTSYKLHTREYIRDFTGDSVYYDEKTKMPSMQTTRIALGTTDEFWISIDTNFNKVKKTQGDRVWLNQENADGSITATANNIVIKT